MLEEVNEYNGQGNLSLLTRAITIGGDQGITQELSHILAVRLLRH